MRHGYCYCGNHRQRTRGGGHFRAKDAHHAYWERHKGCVRRVRDALDRLKRHNVHELSDELASEVAGWLGGLRHCLTDNSAFFARQKLVCYAELLDKGTRCIKAKELPPRRRAAALRGYLREILEEIQWRGNELKFGIPTISAEELKERLDRRLSRLRKAAYLLEKCSVQVAKKENVRAARKSRMCAIETTCRRFGGNPRAAGELRGLMEQFYALIDAKQANEAFQSRHAITRITGGVLPPKLNKDLTRCLQQYG